MVLKFPLPVAMKTSSKIVVSMSLLLLGVVGSGCGGPKRETVMMPNGEEWPAVLHMSYTPSSDDPEGRLEFYKQFSSYLESQLGLEIDLVRASSYGPTIEAMRAEKIDLGSGGSFTYMIAHEKAGAIALVTRGYADGTPGIYSSIIATSPSTGLKTMDDLKARAAELTFGFTDPASTSGHLVPRGYLESIGLKPEDVFKEVVFTQSHLNVCMTTVAGRVDAGGMSRNTYDRMVEAGRIKSEDLHILWESPPIPTGPWFARQALPDGLRQALVDAFVHMDERDPELMAKFREQAQRPDMVWLAADDKMWDGLRAIAYNLETVSLLQGDE